jgi:hypothetical protein
MSSRAINGRPGIGPARLPAPPAAHYARHEPTAGSTCLEEVYPAGLLPHQKRQAQSPARVPQAEELQVQIC